LWLECKTSSLAGCLLWLTSRDEIMFLNLPEVQVG
jgi:hypothetical protein